MEVIFDKRFTKDAKKIKDPRTKQKLRAIIEQLEQVSSFKAIVSIKKLQGHSTAYRIRIGDYRVGFFLIDEETIELVRVLHRKDMYANFP